MRVLVRSEWKQNPLIGSLESCVWAGGSGERRVGGGGGGVASQCFSDDATYPPILCGASATQRGADAVNVRSTSNGAKK